MQRVSVIVFVAVIVCGCATDERGDVFAGLEEVKAVTVIDEPSARPGSYAPGNRYEVERGEYLVELLACGSCHTDGALVGEPDFDKALAGSRVGIAFASPLGNEHPGVVYPPNITPDRATGIGDWSDFQIANAIRAGVGRHASTRIVSMPWPGYARITDDDVEAIVSYLRSIQPVRHATPERVPPGRPAKYPFVYFGVYRSN